MEVISKTSEYLQPNPGESQTGQQLCIQIIYSLFTTETSFSLFFLFFPFAASRAKLSMLNTMSKIRGQVKNPGYPQAEGLLGECMAKYGRELGEDTNFGNKYALVLYSLVQYSKDVCDHLQCGACVYMSGSY